ncbi:centrosomal protein of 70 kDa isoform X1 [Tiliqua scincoides]|uniref:centrosomal protein of 70 kDa isoform X1 n=1 Tax=Tiliqua scincoides TaxID=71010 RepID=UPI003461C9A1
MEETERQRKIVRGLIEDNRQLREELCLERNRASRQEQRANDLDIIVENIKHKIRQLEDESIAKVCQQQNQVKELQKDQQASQAKYLRQTDRLQEQEETIAHLQKELSRLGTEEQQRISTQKKMFRQFCKQAPRTHLDQQICCLIDYYESQINQIKKDLRKSKRETDYTQGLGKEKEDILNIDATTHYKNLLLSFQNQIIETKSQNEQLLLENSSLKKELKIRPTVQDLKFYKHQVKKLEKTLKNNKSQEINKDEHVKENRELRSATGGDQLQEVCRSYLRVLNSIDSVVRSPKRAPLVIHLQRKGLPQNGIKEDDQDCGFEHLPLTIEMWADQLIALKNVYRSLKKLLLQLVPWNTVAMQDNNECIKVEDLQLIVDIISEDIENKEKKSHVPSQQTLYAIVSHFQKLFDVNSLNGVYPRMNEVYTKLGEMTNAMRNLHDVLELDPSAPPSVLVNTVGNLCSLLNENVTWQVEQLLGTQDIERLIGSENHMCYTELFGGRQK